MPFHEGARYCCTSLQVEHVQKPFKKRKLLDSTHAQEYHARTLDYIY